MKKLCWHSITPWYIHWTRSPNISAPASPRRIVCVATWLTDNRKCYSQEVFNTNITLRWLSRKCTSYRRRKLQHTFITVSLLQTPNTSQDQPRFFIFFPPFRQPHRCGNSSVTRYPGIKITSPIQLKSSSTRPWFSHTPSRVWLRSLQPSCWWAWLASCWSQGRVIGTCGCCCWFWVLRLPANNGVVLECLGMFNLIQYCIPHRRGSWKLERQVLLLFLLWSFHFPAAHG